MKTTLHFHLVIFFVAFFLWADNVHAYLDMGSGSYLIHMFLAGVLGTLFFLRNYWKRAREALISLFKNWLWRK